MWKGAGSLNLRAGKADLSGPHLQGVGSTKKVLRAGKEMHYWYCQLIDVPDVHTCISLNFCVHADCVKDNS